MIAICKIPGWYHHMIDISVVSDRSVANMRRSKMRFAYRTLVLVSANMNARSAVTF